MEDCGRQRIEERINRSRLHIQPEELAVGDCVHLKSSGPLPFLALVESVLGGIIGCRWIYRANELQTSLLASVRVACCEVFLSSHRDENLTSSVIRKLFVSEHLGSSGDVSYVLDDHLVCRFEVDSAQQRLSPVSDWRPREHPLRSPDSCFSEVGGSCNSDMSGSWDEPNASEACTAVAPQATAWSAPPDFQSSFPEEFNDWSSTGPDWALEVADPIPATATAGGLDVPVNAKWVQAEVKYDGTWRFGAMVANACDGNDFWIARWKDRRGISLSRHASSEVRFTID
jgi:hypothetical protein